MPPVRTVVAAGDQRTLRALARLLSTERALKLCGFAQDVPTAVTVAHSVRAQLVLVDAGLDGMALADWPPAAKRVLLGDGVDEIRLEHVASELPALLRRLFP